MVKQVKMMSAGYAYAQAKPPQINLGSGSAQCHVVRLDRHTTPSRGIII